MKYIGSKNRYAKELLPIILKNRKKDQYYIEPFVGGANMIDKVNGKRIGNDNNKYVIALLKALQNYWTPPIITKEEYKEIKNNKFNTINELVGWAGICCSYSGKWFGGYAGKVKTKTGTLRDYQMEALINIKKQVENLQGIIFTSVSYDKMDIPENSIIYCDPPYFNTTKYKEDFNHENFWKWCIKKAKEGHEIFISEYNTPKEFKCIWEKQTRSSLSANGKIGGSKKSIEKLFTIK